MKYPDTYSIGEVCSICNVTKKTLHHYDKIGLLVPMKKQETGYRYYSKQHIHQLQIINTLKDLSFSLQEIQDILTADDISLLQFFIQEKLQMIETQSQLLKRQIAAGANLLTRLQKGSFFYESAQHACESNDMPIDQVILEDIPEQAVIYTRYFEKVFDNNEANLPRWSEILRYVTKENAIVTGPICTTYHCEPFEHFYCKSCDYEIHVPVEPITPSNPAIYKSIPAYQAASTIHAGNYDSEINAYLRLMRWIGDNHYHIVGPCHDQFILSPFDTSSPDKYITKILIPVSR